MGCYDFSRKVWGEGDKNAQWRQPRSKGRRAACPRLADATYFCGEKFGVAGTVSVPLLTTVPSSTPSLQARLHKTNRRKLLDHASKTARISLSVVAQIPGVSAKKETPIGAAQTGSGSNAAVLALALSSITRTLRNYRWYISSNEKMEFENATRCGGK
jgi:hypothetical protein